MFSFFTIYIYLRQKNPDEIGDFGKINGLLHGNFRGEAGSGVTGQGNTVFHARKQRFLAKKTLFSQW